MGRPKGSKNKAPSKAGEVCSTGHNQRRSQRRAGILPPFNCETTIEEAIEIAGIKGT